MEPFGLERLRQNAYRVLGLTAGADQAAIDQAARMMRLLGDDTPPPTANDAAWLGDVKRTPKDVERAVMRLATPEMRVRERIWWYCAQPPARPDGVSGNGAGPDEEQHDRLLTRLARLMQGSLGRMEVQEWREVITHFSTLGASPGYAEYLRAAERFGEFEKGARPEELTDAQSGMVDEIAAALVLRGDEALDQPDVALLGRVLQVLAEMPESPAMTALLEKLFNRIEDLLTSQCKVASQTVEEAWRTRDRQKMTIACNSVANDCQSTILQLASEMSRHKSLEPDRLVRVHGRVVKLLMYLADAYCAIYETVNAQKVLRWALEYAIGTPDEQRIQGWIRRLGGNVSSTLDGAAFTAVAEKNRKQQTPQGGGRQGAINLTTGRSSKTTIQTSSQVRVSDATNTGKRKSDPRIVTTQVVFDPQTFAKAPRNPTSAGTRALVSVLMMVLVAVGIGMLNGYLASQKDRAPAAEVERTNQSPDFSALLRTVQRQNQPSTPSVDPWSIPTIPTGLTAAQGPVVVPPQAPLPVSGNGRPQTPADSLNPVHLGLNPYENPQPPRPKTAQDVSSLATPGPHQWNALRGLTPTPPPSISLPGGLSVLPPTGGPLFPVPPGDLTGISVGPKIGDLLNPPKTNYQNK
jgi:hypothetical protein